MTGPEIFEFMERVRRGVDRCGKIKQEEGREGAMGEDMSKYEGQE